MNLGVQCPKPQDGRPLGATMRTLRSLLHGFADFTAANPVASPRSVGTLLTARVAGGNYFTSPFSTKLSPEERA